MYARLFLMKLEGPTHTQKMVADLAALKDNKECSNIQRSFKKYKRYPDNPITEFIDALTGSQDPHLTKLLFEISKWDPEQACGVARMASDAISRLSKKIHAQTLLLIMRSADFYEKLIHAKTLLALHIDPFPYQIFHNGCIPV